jgi:hypothetical protein
MGAGELSFTLLHLMLLAALSDNNREWAQFNAIVTLSNENS